MVSKELKLLTEKEFIGRNVSIGEGVVITNAHGEKCSEIIVGDNVYIGDFVRILAPAVYIGDYTVIHQRTTIYGYSPIRIGHCSWIGQDAIINCTGPVWIGEGVTIGAKTTLWTHLSGGDILQGFRLGKVKASLIGDDTWIAPAVTISPVKIGKKCCVLAGSVVTKDLEENSIYAGVPAVDVKEKLGGIPYQELNLDEKFAIIRDKLIEFDRNFKDRGGEFSSFPTTSDWRSIYLGNAGSAHSFTIPTGEDEFLLGSIVITKGACEERNGFSVFSVKDRLYTKRLSIEEIAFMRFLLPAVKFFPLKDINKKHVAEVFRSLLPEFGAKLD